MTRHSLLGAAVFGIMGFVSGYLWTAFEFPYAVALQWFVGWALMTWWVYGHRTSMLAALTGGLTFMVAFLVAMGLALTDGSSISIASWMIAPLAAAVAGGATGAVLAGRRGVLPMAGFALAGMAVGTLITTFMRDFAPAGTDVPGMAQYVWFATAQGIVGASLGAGIGAGIIWLHEHIEHVVHHVRPHRPVPSA